MTFDGWRANDLQGFLERRNRRPHSAFRLNRSPVSRPPATRPASACTTLGDSRKKSSGNSRRAWQGASTHGSHLVAVQVSPVKTAGYLDHIAEIQRREPRVGSWRVKVDRAATPNELPNTRETMSRRRKWMKEALAQKWTHCSNAILMVQKTWRGMKAREVAEAKRQMYYEATLTLQRHWRAYLHRSYAFLSYRVFHMAIVRAQAWMRGCLTRLRLHRWQQKRHKAASIIQRAMKRYCTAKTMEAQIAAAQGNKSHKANHAICVQSMIRACNAQKMFRSIRNFAVMASFRHRKKRNAAALRIQTAWNVHHGYCLIKNIHLKRVMAVIKIQRKVRRRIVVTEISPWVEAARKIIKVFQGRVVRRKIMPVIHARRRALAKLQMLVRRRTIARRCRVRFYDTRAVTIQSIWRKHDQYERYQKTKIAISVLQRNIKGFLARANRPKIEKQLEFRCLNYVSQMGELRKVARITDFTASAWHPDRERCRQMEVLLKYKRPLRACYMRHTLVVQGAHSSWANCFLVTPDLWLKLVADLHKHRARLPAENLMRIYSKCNEYLTATGKSLSEEMAKHDKGSLNKETAKAVWMSLNEFIESVVRIAKLWARTEDGIEQIKAHLNRSTLDSVELSVKLKVYMEQFLEKWSKKAVLTNDGMLDIALEEPSIKGVLNTNRLPLRKLFDTFSSTKKVTLPELQSKDQADVVWKDHEFKGLSCEEFLHMLKIGQVVGHTLSIEKVLSVFVNCNQTFFDSMLGQEADINSVEELMMLSYKDFQRALIVCTMTAGRLQMQTQNLAGSASRLSRFVEKLRRNCELEELEHPHRTLTSTESRPSK